MDSFIYCQPGEEDFEYRLRLWKSRELWDYLQINWKEEDMPNMMTQKIIVMKQQLYRMSEDDIVAEKAYYQEYLTTTDQSHEVVWCQMYFRHLADRKAELQMEIAMDTFTM